MADDSKPADAPATTTAPAAARDYEGELKAALGAVEKATKRAAAAEAKIGDGDKLREQLAKVFGSDKPDPAAEAVQLRLNADRFQQLASTSIAREAILRVAAREFEDPVDAVALLSVGVEVDLATGQVKDTAALKAAADALLVSKPYLRRAAPALAVAADKAGPLPPAKAPVTPQPTGQPALPAPVPARQAATMDLAELRARRKARADAGAGNVG